MTAAVPTSAPRRIGPALTGGARARHLVRRALAAEAANWRSLDRVLFGRRRVPAGASPHGYDRPVRTVLVIFLVLSIVEVPIVDLLVHPWPAVRFPLLALGIWGVLTVLGLLCGYLSRPHAVGPEGIRVRHGGEADVALPWSVVASVQRARHAIADAAGLSLTGRPGDETLNQVIQDVTDIEIELEGPTTLDLPQGAVTVSRVRIAVDDPAAFLDAVRTHIP
jgi:hypothetical protein